MTIEKFQVPGVSCGHCVNAVTKSVSAVPGVVRVDVSLTTRVVTVEHDTRATTTAIVAAIQDAGYDEVATLAS